ncbi:MAG: hypothetical protein KA419_17895 [Acidobacteria bacterium]|nr:hypothetical protein [Acidobacteriota bacterium]
MSFDLAVWSKNAVASPAEAGELYARLCDDPSGVYDDLPASRGIETFYRELTAQHPEIDDVPEEEIDNTDLCPWSIAFDRSDKHILLCAVWSKADYVENLVRTLAEKHDLALFNPQTGTLHLLRHPMPRFSGRGE